MNFHWKKLVSWGNITCKIIIRMVLERLIIFPIYSVFENKKLNHIVCQEFPEKKINIVNKRINKVSCASSCGTELEIKYCNIFSTQTDKTFLFMQSWWKVCVRATGSHLNTIHPSVHFGRWDTCKYM